MPDSKPCLDARASLDEIRSLRSEFESAYSGAATFGNPDGAARAAALRAEIEGKVAALRETVAVHEAERTFDLRRQYDAQTSLLRRVGLVEAATEIDGSGIERETLFVTGIDGNRYPIPSYETVALRMAERRELLGTKADQGFAKLLLVPFGMSVKNMVNMLAYYLRRYKFSYDTAHKSDVPRKTFDLKLEQPVNLLPQLVDADITGSLVYDPVEFGPDHGGMTKREILAAQGSVGDAVAGWRVLLLQAGEEGRGIRVIPGDRASGASVGAECPRPDIVPGESAADYLQKKNDADAREDSPYRGESGMCLEEWIVAFITHLQETGKPLDSCNSSTESLALLNGAYVPSEIFSIPRVTWASWNQFDSQIELSGYEPSFVGVVKHFAPRYAVRL